MARVKILLPEKFLFETTIPIRISDINYGGHLANDAVLSIAHEARLRFLNAWNYSEMDIEGSSIIMSDCAIEYKSEGHYGDILHINIGISDIGRVGCDIIYLFLNEKTQKEVARVKTGIVFFDYHEKRINIIPENFLRKIS